MSKPDVEAHDLIGKLTFVIQAIGSDLIEAAAEIECGQTMHGLVAVHRSAKIAKDWSKYLEERRDYILASAAGKKAYTSEDYQAAAKRFALVRNAGGA